MPNKKPKAPLILGNRLSPNIKIPPAKRKKFDLNDVSEIKKKELSAMAQREVEKALPKPQAKVAKTKKVVTPENVTMYDIYLELRALRADVKIVKKQHESFFAPKNEEMAKCWPFALPIRNMEDLKACEKFLKTPSNFDDMVSLSLKF